MKVGEVRLQRLLLLTPVAAVVVVLILLAMASAAGAQRSCPPDPLSSCLPGSGYTFDQSWNCGAHTSAANCYFDSVLSKAHAERHTWGWGSSDYDGSGNISACIAAEGSTVTVWGACGTNLARACAISSCSDPSTENYLFLDVFHNSSGTRLVKGRGMA